METAELTRSDLDDAWSVLSSDERFEGFLMLSPQDAEDFFQGLSARDQAELVGFFPVEERRRWIRLLAPDDAVDLIQESGADDRSRLLALLDDRTRREVIALLAYAEDEAGGLMNPRYARVRPDMSVDEAISYVRRQAQEKLATIYYAYVLDADQHLLGVVSFRDLFSAVGNKTVREIMHADIVKVSDEMDQEHVAQVFSEHNLVAIPVVDSHNLMKGIVTVDDIVDVVQEEATEDIQKFGGMEALDVPYLEMRKTQMIKKRIGWLAVLFVGETLTASAIAYFETAIARAVVLALFIPLIISSGGNSGSQTSMLVIRAMALGELRLRDWWRVVRREILMGLALGGMLGLMGFMRVLFWPNRVSVYGEYYLLVGVTVALSLVGIVLWGTLCGSALPFVLRRCRLDPASASAPFVATLVDVTGIIIYFTVASVILRGTLL